MHRIVCVLATVALAACGGDSAQDPGAHRDAGLLPGSDAGLLPGSDAGPPPGSPRAFYSAEGAGAFVTGGRGGEIVAVTRLDDARDGNGDPVEGTLRFALTREFTRTIVFRISGTIVVGDEDGDGEIDAGGQRPGMIGLENPNYGNFTVAGQTAPLGGISIKGYIYTSGVSNMIWRYIRIRKNDNFNDFDALTINGSKDVVLDHLSLAYGSDEGWSITHSGATVPQTGVSVQYSLIGESKTGTILGSVSGGDLGGEASIHHNFWTEITHRFPNTAANGSYEIINNLTYNWAFRLVNVVNAPKVNHINNAYVEGARTLASSGTSGNHQRISHKVHLGDATTLGARIYTAGNFISGFLTDATEDNWFTWTVFVGGNGYAENDPAPASLQVMSAHPMLGAPVTIDTAAEVMTDLPDRVGAYRTLTAAGLIQEYRDSVDDEFIAQYKNDSGLNYTINANEFVYPQVPSNPPYADQDGDGMPDEWESANGFDPAVADGHLDADGNGYSNLEQFLNLVDG